MTLNQFTKAVKQANPGITIRWKADVQEFRVNFVGGAEETAYYTADRDDAAQTARAMWDSRYIVKAEEN